MPNRLDEYSRRRDFSATDEPTAEGTRDSPPGSSRFVVQRHAASTLHFDLRLEVGGTLYSWAVPKGLPLRQGIRRRAIRTEDHPIAYLDYEGTIPAGHYGAGRMSIWDRGTYDAILISDDEIKVRLRGSALSAEYHLVRTDDDNWLIFRSGQWGTRCDDPSERFVSLRPMLASVEPAAFDDPGWSFEIKWDGWRATCLITSDTLDLRSRSGQALLPRFPGLQGIRADLNAQEAVLDGEVCVLNDTGAADFSALQSGTGVVTYVVFDLLYVDGHWIMDRPYDERRDRLRDLVDGATSGALLLSDDVHEYGRSLFQQIADRGGEGIVAKRRASPYVPGTRSADWRKITSRFEIEATICGFVPGQGARRDTFGALVLAEDTGGSLRYIGRVGSGFSDRVLHDLRAQLDALVVGDCPLEEVPGDEAGAVWVQPTVRCRIRHKEWTPDGRLRAPVFLGLESHDRPEQRPAVLDLSSSECRVVDGSREIRLTNLHKVFWPRDGLRKGDLLDHYARCAEVLVPHLRSRPMVLKRYPDGIEASHFFQHALPDGAPNWLSRVDVDGEDPVTYTIVDDPLSLLWVVNLGCIDLNPWHSRVGMLDRADWVLFDLDPQEGVPFSSIAQLALHCHDLLESVGLRSYAKTSGSRGIHVMVPIEPTPHEAVRLFAQVVSSTLVSRYPRLATMETHKMRRGTRVYLDARQNGLGKTIASVYSVRPVRGGRVSTPLTWDELSDGVDPSQFTMSTVHDRVERMGDLFAPVLDGDQDLAAAVEAL